MRTDELDFDLPPEPIAQDPPAYRAVAACLPTAGRARLSDIRYSVNYRVCFGGHLLVFNDTKVLPARFMLRKLSDGAIEGLFIRQVRPGHWLVLLKGLENYRGPLRFDADKNVTATCVAALAAGQYEINLKQR